MREKHRLAASPTHPDWELYVLRPGIAHTQAGDQIHNLVMGSDWELNLPPLGYLTILQPTEPHRPVGFKGFVVVV